MSLLTNLEAYYACSEGTGTVTADSSGNARGLALINSGTPNTMWITGKSGNGLTFAGGSSQSATGAWTGLGGTGAFSIAGWFRTSDSAAGTHDIISWGVNTGAGSLVQLSHEAGVLVYRGVSAVGTWGSGLNNSAWHSFCLTKAAGATTNQLKLYVDSSLLTGSFPTGPTVTLNISTSSGAISVGGIAGSSSFYTGAADEIGIWSRELTAAEAGVLAAGVVYPFVAPILSAEIYYSRTFGGCQ